MLPSKVHTIIVKKKYDFGFIFYYLCALYCWCTPRKYCRKRGDHKAILLLPMHPELIEVYANGGSILMLHYFCL